MQVPHSSECGVLTEVGSIEGSLDAWPSNAPSAATARVDLTMSRQKIGGGEEIAACRSYLHAEAHGQNGRYRTSSMGLDCLIRKLMMRLACGEISCACSNGSYYTNSLGVTAAWAIVQNIVFITNYLLH